MQRQLAFFQGAVFTGRVPLRGGGRDLTWQWAVGRNAKYSVDSICEDA
ncbi:hypothetical protein SDC9_196206 [bioreactor metagenome]|uniref:Uncharacterized protein n=1 Tax=bioreactor metagenome TaxID=1076179 RepID=A0A645ICF6_9ZZZZ